jgi:undecaprenyl-diphosphatase
MSVTNGFNRVEGEALSAARRCAANVMTALTLLIRPARAHARLCSLAPRQPAIAAAIAVAVFLILIVTIDAAAIRGVQHVPRWIVAIFDDITDYGKSGWFLWPLGLLFIALAALPSALTPFSQRVLAAIMVRVGFLFTAIAVPGLFVTIVKRMIGRGRWLAAAWIRICSVLSHGTRPTLACRPGMPPRPLQSWWLSGHCGRAPARSC